LIDLHSHTDASDGSHSPAELISLALHVKLEVLAITDHDTFDGYERAEKAARKGGLELICGVELSTRHRGKSVHLLGYFLHGGPNDSFATWLKDQQAKRRERNERLAARLRELGLDIQLREAEAIGRNMTGRPHFARLLVRKGYAKDGQEAFDRYLGETGAAYVERDETPLIEAISRVNAGAGFPSLAHPIRLGKTNRAEEEQWIGELAQNGLRGIEVYHSDHKPADMDRYLSYAQKYELRPTGGSDFHGDNKPGIRLGSGINGNLAIPKAVLEEMRR
jgi:predicted metal-dependent phosphoesterase TrpH